MKKISFLLIALFLLQTTSLWAWGNTGHRIVAEIAEQHLSKKAKRELKKVIGNQKLAYWANWPDFIKSDSAWKHADGWHYINVPQGMDRTAFNEEMERSTNSNLYKKSLELIEALKDNKLELEKKQQYLYFLIHMIGDAHQPLHVGRLEDLGGNKISLEWFGQKTNLHSLWDSKLVDFNQYSYTEFTEVINVHDQALNQALAQGTLADWIFDSYQIAEVIYGAVKVDERLSYRYHYQNEAILERQLLKGGLRLAKVLNEIFE